MIGVADIFPTCHSFLSCLYWLLPGKAGIFHFGWREISSPLPFKNFQILLRSWSPPPLQDYFKNSLNISCGTFDSFHNTLFIMKNVKHIQKQNSVMKPLPNVGNYWLTCSSQTPSTSLSGPFIFEEIPAILSLHM